MSTQSRFTKNQWLSLAASVSGWTLDAMDWMMLALALPLGQEIVRPGSAANGLAGDDDLGRRRSRGNPRGHRCRLFRPGALLMFTMIWYSVFTGLCGFAQNYEQLSVLRLITGLGLGGEWGVGARWWRNIGPTSTAPR